MQRRSIFFFDGGSRPNPGPMEAAVVRRGEVCFRDDLGIGDNNQAEWLALLFAVELAAADAACEPLFIGDSKLVIEQAMELLPCRSPQLQPYLIAFKQAVTCLPGFRLRHVRRSKNLAGIALAQRRPF